VKKFELYGNEFKCIGWLITRNRWEYYILRDDEEPVPDDCYLAYVIGFESEVGLVSKNEVEPHISIRLDEAGLDKAVKEGSLQPPPRGSWLN
jgi:hypothetical protein